MENGATPVSATAAALASVMLPGFSTRRPAVS